MALYRNQAVVIAVACGAIVVLGLAGAYWLMEGDHNSAFTPAKTGSERAPAPVSAGGSEASGSVPAIDSLALPNRIETLKLPPPVTPAR